MQRADELDAAPVAAVDRLFGASRSRNGGHEDP